MPGNVDFESLVARFYAPLYQFAFSLTRAEADACDLTQQTFVVWAVKGHQLRDVSKVKKQKRGCKVFRNFYRQVQTLGSPAFGAFSRI